MRHASWRSPRIWRVSRWDIGWSAAIAVWAEVYCHLRLLDRAGALYELLACYSGQFAVSAVVPARARDTIAYAGRSRRVVVLGRRAPALSLAAVMYGSSDARSSMAIQACGCPHRHPARSGQSESLLPISRSCGSRAGSDPSSPESDYEPDEPLSGARARSARAYSRSK
jgi:hypothetical protein